MTGQTLWSCVRPDYDKLHRRLEKQGISSIAKMDYEKYLRSSFWKRIRGWVLNRDGFICRVCQYKHFNPKKNGMEVHHRDHEVATLAGRTDEMLITLCPRCHEKVEHYPDGRRRVSLDEKESELSRLKELHAEIVATGMDVVMVDESTTAHTKLRIRYIGPYEYTMFYTLPSLVNGVVLAFWDEYHKSVRVPFPFSKDKIYQRSGAGVIDIKTNKKVLVAKFEEGIATLSQPSGCEYAIVPFLRGYIEKAGHWRLVDRVA